MALALNNLKRVDMLLTETEEYIYIYFHGFALEYSSKHLYFLLLSLYIYIYIFFCLCLCIYIYEDCLMNKVNLAKEFAMESIIYSCTFFPEY